eukprot:TRINITY_DN5394_c0_g5_i1.p1 TRINITY_DN5394_c0_g5~~TRINITY_DN5394_c0_g5_i1.p1  ORF type:complete len:178 (-),score=48.89 TRINITY_DN5394_c0_g5_i1:89-553(-)
MAAAKFAAALRSAATSGDCEKLNQILQEAETAGILNKVINEQDVDEDLAALALAALGGHEECVRKLLSSKANPNLASEDSGNRTALHFAAFDSHVEIVKLLLEAKADTSHSCSSGGTAHEVASERAEQWRRGGGDGEENIEALTEILRLLEEKR